jgi:hypothetical protein
LKDENGKKSYGEQTSSYSTFSNPQFHSPLAVETLFLWKKSRKSWIVGGFLESCPSFQILGGKPNNFHFAIICEMLDFEEGAKKYM